MNNYKISIICILSLSLLPKSNLKAQPGKSYGMEYWNWMESYFHLEQKFSDTNFRRLYSFAKVQNDNQVLKESKSLLKKYPDNKSYLKFYIASLYNLGKRDTARILAKMVINKKYNSQVQRNTSNIVALIPFYSNPYFYKIGTDTVIKEYLYSMYCVRYKQKHYTNNPLALKLIKLYYQDQCIRNLLNFNSIKANNIQDANTVYNNYLEAAKKNSREFASLYTEHPNYISKVEVGPVSGYQHLLMWHSSDSLVKNLYLPMLKQAMIKKDISTEEYINLYTKDYIYSGDTRKLKKVTDSLCQLYGCEATIIINDK